MSVISESNESDYLQMKSEFENKEKTYQEVIQQLKSEVSLARSHLREAEKTINEAKERI